jgi:hypothetical protein
VDQIDPSASNLSCGARRGIQRESRPSGIDLGEATVKIEQDRLGVIELGYGDTASDKIDSMNLAESDTLADTGVSAWNGNFFIRATSLTGSNLLTLRWGDFIDGKLMGGPIDGV